MTYTIKRGDTGTPLVAQLIRAGVAYSVSVGTVVRLYMRSLEDQALVVNGAVVTVTTALTGWTTYSFDGPEIDEVGDYAVEWEATTPSGVITFPDVDHPFTLTIAPDVDGEEQYPSPEDSGVCWPIDLGCCDNFDTYSASVQARARMLAGQTMHLLTGGRVGGCPVAVRPCRADACGSGDWVMSSGGYMPVNWAGTWYNCPSCHQGSCGCATVPSVWLPGPVGRVDSVVVDGEALESTAYRVHNSTTLVRVDGESWPLCQDFTEPDGFVVTYLRGVPVDSLGAWMAGVLACEYAKACSGGACRLPKGVTQVTRQGVSYQMSAGLFPDGKTGIQEVDAYLAFWNPSGQLRPSTVWSPDLKTVVREF